MAGGEGGGRIDMRRVRWKIKFVSKTFMYLLEGSLLYKLQTSIRGEGGCLLDIKRLFERGRLLDHLQ